MKTEFIEINLEEYSKELLISLITFSHENNLTINETIIFLLKKYLESENG